MSELASSYVKLVHAIKVNDMAALIAVAEGSRQQQKNPGLYRDEKSGTRMQIPRIALDPDLKPYFKAGFNIQARDPEAAGPPGPDQAKQVTSAPLAKPLLAIFQPLQQALQRGEVEKEGILASFFSGYQQQRDQQTPTRQVAHNQEEQNQALYVQGYEAGRKMANVAEMMGKVAKQNQVDYRSAVNLIGRTSERQAESIMEGRSRS